MLIIEKIVYRCQFCKKNYFIQKACEKHEVWCSKNPENKRICFGCENLEEFQKEYDVSDYYGSTDITKTSKAFFCKALNKNLFPLSVERRALNIKYPETFLDEEPMKKECDEFLEQSGWNSI
jgi:hypothetical protein